MTPYFSIIIPLYNKEKFIKKTLESVFNQIFTDYEILIIDDGSTDKSCEIISNFNDFRLKIYHQTNKGVSFARNLGIKKANAKYIAFLDADDYWHPHFLKTFFNIIQIHNSYHVFSAAIEVENGNRTSKASYSIQQNNFVEILDFFTSSLKESIIWTSCVVLDQEVFKSIGGFDTTIKGGEDTDLWIRIGLQYKVVFCWDILAKYVFDRNSLSRKDSYFLNVFDFSKYEKFTKQNLDLKKFLDYNRFSVALKVKMKGETIQFQKIKNQIDKKNLPLKKRILLNCPVFLLKTLVNLRLFLFKTGLSNSIFK
ncbi:Glycosyl transferase, group 2 family protein [Flavobacterium branchiophilum]|uniref:Glycosyl transferase, group 2 family protein n=1 Tax=Flavobacterium branchiophilum (strain FL-15) TaxID=1034807 RepID=G2Z754_FLABF|nr:glycosyltransferase family A protein [Flavobacterium branchiophilum]CCB69000.1 Glycosyl transferase, group 2 family protein [Flavobacterium branchiophilum FL-15]